MTLHNSGTGFKFTHSSFSGLIFTGAAIAVATGLLGVTGCAEFSDPYGSRYPSNSGYNDPYNTNYGRYDDRGYSDRERREAERERERLRDERERLERERDRDRAEDQRRRFDDLRQQQHERDQQNNQYHQPEQCPSGFHETSRKCSDDERRHGCKDIKTPSGLRCINR